MDRITVCRNIHDTVRRILQAGNRDSLQVVIHAVGKDTETDQTDFMVVIIIDRLIHGENLLAARRRRNDTGIEDASAGFNHAVMQLLQRTLFRSGDHAAHKRVCMRKHLGIPLADIDTLQERNILGIFLRIFLCHFRIDIVIRILQQIGNLLCMAEGNQRFLCVRNVVVDNNRTFIIDCRHMRQRAFSGPLRNKE